MATEATNEKVIVKDTVVNDNAWENLGALIIYDLCGAHIGTGHLLFKVVPGLGKRFKVLYNGTAYYVKKSIRSGIREGQEAHIPGIGYTIIDELNDPSI